MKTVISEKGQITIPKEIRDQFGLRAGTEIGFSTDSDGVRLYKIVSSDPIDRWRGRGKGARTISTDEYLRAVRDENSD